jgi:hypothetical protein
MQGQLFSSDSLLAEINQVIENHGGWPGAFTSKPEAGAPA